jgi:NAD(P)-dependent dehydrogenase (short-subunit alcohol dehydrogenase family)
MKLEGKVALVTGAGRRIGASIARALAARGAAVAVHHLTAEVEARALAADIEAAGGRAVALRADLTQASEVDALVRTTVEQLGGLDILINNASTFARVPFLETTEADWDRALDTNLKSAFLCCRAAAPHLLARGGGKIVSLADVAGVRPWAEYIPYSVAKAGVVALTVGLAKALAPIVQVNAIAPGVVLGEGFPEDVVKRQLARVPLKREGSPADVVGAVLYFMDADYVTGVCLPVDGGRLAT